MILCMKRLQINDTIHQWENYLLSVKLTIKLIGQKCLLCLLSRNKSALFLYRVTDFMLEAPSDCSHNQSMQIPVINSENINSRRLEVLNHGWCISHTCVSESVWIDSSDKVEAYLLYKNLWMMDVRNTSREAFTVDFVKPQLLNNRTSGGCCLKSYYKADLFT